MLQGCQLWSRGQEQLSSLIKDMTYFKLGD